jgi:hypothetical protein
LKVVADPVRVALIAALGEEFHADTDSLRRAVRDHASANVIHLTTSTKPEDILLQQLRGYRLGNEISDRQWRDILGIVLTQDDRLDVPYLERGAQVLGVSDLLARALSEAGGK